MQQPAPRSSNLSDIIIRSSQSLGLDGVRIWASVFDLEAIRLVERAMDANTSIVIHHPDPYNHLSLFGAIAAHVWRVNRLIQSGVREVSDLRVVVVSRDARLRSAYRRSRIGSAPLSTVVPMEMLSANGGYYRVGNLESRGSTVFVNSVSEALRCTPRDFVVVDSPCEDLAKARQLGCPFVVVARDPADRALISFLSSFPIFAWDDPDVSSLEKLAASEGPELQDSRSRLATIAQGVQVRVHAVDAPGAAAAFASVWRDLPQLFKACEKSPLGKELLRDFFGLLYDLLNLCAPTAAYENQFGSLLMRVRSLSRAAEIVRGDAGEFYLPYLGESLQEIIKGFGDMPRKATEFEKLIASLPGPLRVIAPNARMRQLVASQLHALGRDDADVVTLAQLPRLPSVQTAIMTGMAPGWSRFVYRSGSAKVFYVLAYDDGIASGSSEASLTQRHEAEQCAYRKWHRRQSARQRCEALLAGTIPPSGADPEPFPPQILVPEVASVPPIELPIALWDDLVDFSSNETFATVSGESHEASSVSKALRIRFQDGRYALVSAESSMTLLQRNESTPGVRASDIKPGDIVIAIDNETRKDLLDKVIEVGNEVPELALSAALLTSWRDILRIGYQKFITYKAFSAALAALGTAVGVQAVRLWVVGKTIGPEDPEDVRRVGEAIGNMQVAKNYMQFVKAINAFRNAHDKLKRRISSIAQKHAGGSRQADEIVDERSGLTVGDFRDCIDLLTVVRIDDAGEMPNSLLGPIRSE